MAKSIPDRWTAYKPIGERIEGTRFIAFKVPLEEHVSRHVEREHRLDHRILLSTIPNLGLIIDLTNTQRYYDPVVFKKEGVGHKKIMIPGHVTPPRHLTEIFIKIVKEFLENNKDNDKLIGVHCTHGVNRTGYLICNYMISQMTVKPNEAIRKFGNARGHKIERTNYIEALHKRSETKIVKCREREELPRTKISNWRKSEEPDTLSYYRGYTQRSERSDPKRRRKPYDDHNAELCPRPHKN